MSLTLPISYARTAFSSKGTPVPIRTSIMTMAHAINWDTKIQPAILADPTQRADKYWSWSLFRSVFPLVQYIKARRRCLALTTLVRNAANQAVPAGMSLVIERYPHLPRQRTQDASFVWFISSAPKLALRNLGVPDPPSLGTILIDTAMVVSANLGFQGRIGLHCAVAGGTKLMNFYQTDCGLIKLPKRVIMTVAHANDGRFFYSDDALSETLMRAVDTSR